jgi:multisubunit Na+/H+ antiporter MnhB subunit
LAEAVGYGFLMGMQSKEPGRSGTKPLCSFRFRRNFLFVATLVTLVLVFLGAVPFHEKLSESAVRFTVFWAGVFVLATVVLALAVYDLARVRRDHQMRVRELEKELAAAAADARELIRRQAELEPDDPESSRS